MYIYIFISIFNTYLHNIIEHITASINKINDTGILIISFMLI